MHAPIANVNVGIHIGGKGQEQMTSNFKSEFADARENICGNTVWVIVCRWWSDLCLFIILQTVVRADPHIGLLHRATEKLIEYKTYLQV